MRSPRNRSLTASRVPIHATFSLGQSPSLTVYKDGKLNQIIYQAGYHNIPYEEMATFKHHRLTTIAILLVVLAHQGNASRSSPSSFYFDFMNDLNGGSDEHGETGSGHGSSPGVSWNNNWGWGSSPRSGWGYGSGSAEGPSGSWKASGFGFGTGSGTGTGSGSGYGYGTGTNDGGGDGGGHGGAYGYGRGSGNKDEGNGEGGGGFHDPEKLSIPPGEKRK